MCSFMLICQCCFAIIKVLLKKVTYLLTYCTFTTNKARAPKPPQEIAEVAYNKSDDLPVAESTVSKH